MPQTKDGAGPDALTGQTYSEIQKETEARDLAIRRLKFGDEAKPVLPPGAVPISPQNVWNSVDRGPGPPVEEDE